MAGHVQKRRKLMNPAARRRRMTPKQIKFFGTKAQKAGLKRRNASKRAHPYASRKVRRAVKSGDKSKMAHYAGRHTKRYFKRAGISNQGDIVSRVAHTAERAIDRVEDLASAALGTVSRKLQSNRGRRKNVGEILTVVPAVNPGRRRTMKRAQNRRGSRRNWRDPKTGLANRRRRANRGHRRHRGARRNPGMLSGNVGAVVGILGGAAVTKIVKGFLPAGLSGGMVGYVTTGLTAVAVGRGIGAMTKNRQLGNWMTLGGLLIVALEAINQFFPALSLPIGLNSGGMGLISSSNFYVPQVNQHGSMASFVAPAAIAAGVPVAAAGMHGLGGPQFSPGFRTMRRVGRMR